MNRKPSAGILSQKLPALLLFCLFLTPSLTQALHHHDHDGSPSNSRYQGGLLSKYEPCAICSFEFVSFLKSEPVFISKGDLERHTFPSGLCEAPVLSDILIISDRAPPLS